MNPIHALTELDVTDSMGRSIEALGRAIESIDASNRGNAQEQMELIHGKVLEIEDYFWRPVDSRDIYEELRKLALELGDEDKARHYAAKIALFQANEWEFKGRVQDFFGNKVKALEYYSKALECVPDHELALPGHGKALKNIDKARSIAAIMERKLQKQEGDARQWFRYGMALLNLGEVEKAIECFDKVIELAPSDADAWARKGTAIESLGNYSEAKHYLEKALELKPSSMIAKRGMNYADYFLGLL